MKTNLESRVQGSVHHLDKIHGSVLPYYTQHIHTDGYFKKIICKASFSLMKQKPFLENCNFTQVDYDFSVKTQCNACSRVMVGRLNSREPDRNSSKIKKPYTTETYGRVFKALAIQSFVGGL